MNAEELVGATTKLILACVLGGAIGWQRETHERPAGFRTHILVCVGSCLIMLVSIGIGSPELTGGPRFDPGRIAAQVVSGIGFLGAGTILRQGSIIRGLTTAASLWTTAGIGLAVAAGGSLSILAVMATVLVLLTLTVFGRIEALLISRRQYVEVRITMPRNKVGSLMQFLTERAVGIRNIQSEPPDEAGMQRMHLMLRLPSQKSPEEFSQQLLAIPGVREIDWD